MPTEIRIILLERRLTEAEVGILLEWTPYPWRERLLRVREAEKRQAPLCAYALLRLAIWERCGLYELPLIARTDLGKPYIPEWPGVHFSISHTAAAAMVGLSERPVGVDIERIRPVSRRLLREVEPSEERFFKTWVRREALVKCSGQGVGAMLRGEPPLEDGMHYHEICTASGCAAGAATWESVPPQVRRYSLETLLKCLQTK